MKKFLTMAAESLRSVFWGADPARHTFFALTLWLFGAITAESWYFLTEMSAHWLQIFPPLFMLIFFIAWLRLCRHLLRPRRRVWNWLVVALYVLWVLALFFIWRFEGRDEAYAAAKRGHAAIRSLCMSIAYLAVVTTPWLVPLIVLYRQWRWLLLRFGCFVLGAWLFAELFNEGYVDYFRPGAGMLVLAQLTVVFWLALILFAYWLTAKIYADAAGMPWRRMFGKGVRVVLGIFLASHLAALGAAVVRHFQAERSLAALEKHFGTSLSPQAMAERYYAGRTADGEFWKRAEAALKEVPKWICEDDIDMEHHGFAPTRLEARGGELDASAGLRKLEEMFSAPPPAFARDYRKPMLGLNGENVRMMPTPRDFGRCELARVCRAVAKHDKPTALAALRRLEILRDFLVREDTYIYASIMMWNERRRLHALEWLIGAEMLDESELLAERRRLETLDAALEQVEFHFLRTDAGYAEEFMDSYVRSVRGRGKVLHSTLAWAFPSLWYLYECNRDLVNKSFMIRNYSEAAEPALENLSLKTLLADSVMPGRWSGKKFRALSARYRAMEALIDAAIEKRRTGQYPAMLKNPPTDPFTGKPMKYRFGQVPMRRNYSNAKKADIRFEPHPGVAVWSVGPNGIDEDGANGHDCGGDERDDIRVLIALPELP